MDYQEKYADMKIVAKDIIAHLQQATILAEKGRIRVFSDLMKAPEDVRNLSLALKTVAEYEGLEAMEKFLLETIDMPPDTKFVHKAETKSKSS